MAQDAFAIHHLSIELNGLISGAKIERVNQPSKDAVTFSIRKANENLKLTVNANADFARVCVSKEEAPAPISAPSFCMLLRKHLLRATINKVEPIKYERIIVIDLTCRDELGTLSDKRLYCEIMGKYSNVTLTENGKILGAMKTTGIDESLLRPIYPGAVYKLPAPQEKREISDFENMRELLLSYDANEEFSKFLFNNVKGVSYATALDAVTKFKRLHDFNDEFVINGKIDEFIRFFNDYYETPNLEPTMVSDGKKTDFYIVKPSMKYAAEKSFSGINSLINSYYSFKENSFVFNLKKNRLYDAVKAYEKKVTKKLQIVLEKLLSCADMDKDRLYGELLIAYLYKLKGGEKFCEVENYNEPDYPVVKIKLDENLSPRENAERYFKRYTKQKKTVAAVTPQKAEYEDVLKYLETVFTEIDAAETDDDFSDIEEELVNYGILKNKQNGKKKQKKLSSPRKFIYNGFEVFVGRNNLQNDRLTLSADRNDLWLHTKDYHSSHVIVKTDGRPVPDDVLLFAAQTCAFYSKAKTTTKVPVDYTLKKFVKKPATANTGTVYYTNQKTVFVDPKEPTV